ncbi:MAG TPA: bifunctional phosphoribosyl-AMP cyclohydrolase/phosphoribosyl-ATP diphosphatase, partial [Clostridium sp.]|nr:bifunctional phosphoribosyl-AMP cyclohydrolase/phosphoribosyl-ATP diphosphatase [Clostridium sp.]
MNEIIKNIKFDDKGLIPVIAQDYNTNEVLMMAYMNKEALEKSLETGKAHYFSRSRNKLWQKGETSGHYSCFYREICEKEGLKETQEKVFD